MTPRAEPVSPTAWTSLENASPECSTSLDVCIGDALAFSNQLLMDLRGPADDFGLDMREHLALLLLWERDGMPEQRIAERLRMTRTEADGTLASLQEKAFVERVADAGDVWLTSEGRRVGERVGGQALGERINLLRREIVSLRGLLRHALTLAEQENGAET